MSAQQFVVFDAGGNEIDWIDPYVSHEDVSTLNVQRLFVHNTHYMYRVAIPNGGWFEIREMEA